MELINEANELRNEGRLEDALPLYERVEKYYTDVAEPETSNNEESSLSADAKLAADELRCEITYGSGRTFWDVEAVRGQIFAAIRDLDVAAVRALVTPCQLERTCSYRLDDAHGGERSLTLDEFIEDVKAKRSEIDFSSLSGDSVPEGLPSTSEPDQFYYPCMRGIGGNYRWTGLFAAPQFQGSTPVTGVTGYPMRKREALGTQ
ncbi:MAG: hypothetical protein IT285_01110 [Bdellovibrionales bacterium]|nr:hypothetical protein [Bdellovibrionales bacterium]